MFKFESRNLARRGPVIEKDGVVVQTLVREVLKDRIIEGIQPRPD